VIQEWLNGRNTAWLVHASDSSSPNDSLFIEIIVNYSHFFLILRVLNIQFEEKSEKVAD